jgi:hypothetical protein
LVLAGHNRGDEVELGSRFGIHSIGWMRCSMLMEGSKSN